MLEKMALAVITAARKLYPYFQSHSIEILTNQPLRTVMQNTNHSGRLSKWGFEVSEDDITYKNRTASKSQLLADFLVELTPELQQDLVLPSPNWVLHVDGSSTVKGSDAGVQLQSPTGELIKQSFSFNFPASNNEAEYESLIAGLRLAKAVRAKRLSTYSDSQLFEFFELIKVPRGENVCADAFAALGSKLRDQVKRTIPIHRIETPSINLSEEKILAIAPVTKMQPEEPIIDDQPTLDWRTEFIDYLADNKLPTGKWAATRLKTRITKYVVIDGNLHLWTATKVLLRCIMGEETRLIMAETFRRTSFCPEDQESWVLLANDEHRLRIIRKTL
ncbi:hypothetical protein N665_0054s0015 [Sinapis alba]|nr:hypothetical protein N665_0054s0015 [Sinapis alba]